MTDIVERLREGGFARPDEAADEIETLRQRVQELEEITEPCESPCRRGFELIQRVKEQHTLIEEAGEELRACEVKWNDSASCCAMATNQLTAERAISDKLEKALKDIRWQVAKFSDAEIISEAALAELAAMRKGDNDDKA